MGSVLAASSPNPPPPASGGTPAPGLTVPPGFGMPPVSAVIPQTGESSAQQQESENALPNPGAFDECHRKCKGKRSRLEKNVYWSGMSVCSRFVLPVCVFSSEVFPLQMEGVKLVVNKGLSNHFQVS